MCFECFNKLPIFFYRGQEFLVWYNDKNCRVGFSELPHICNKYINKEIMSEEEIKKAKKKPLFLANSIIVCLIDKRKSKTYVFTINTGYDYDGASISRFLWRIIGSKENIEFKIAALIHDVLCENHGYIDNDRYFSTFIFERLLFIGDVGDLKRWVMKHSVDNYQKILGKWG